MKKEIREIERLAEHSGIERARVIPGMPHARIVGTVGGKAISIVVSLTKALSHGRNFACLKLNIRRAVREASR